MVVENEKVWGELDAAVARLSRDDRNVIALRYLRGHSVGETAAELGISTEAAGRRIGRALKRLREGLIRRNAIGPGVGLMGILEQIPRIHTPTGLAGKTAAAALSPGLAPVGVSVANGVLKMIMWTQIKLAVVAIAIVGVLTGGGLVTVSLLNAQTAPPGPPQGPKQSVGGFVSGNFSTVVDGFDGTPGLVASLGSGVAIKLEGVTYDDAGRKPWWSADGTRLGNGPYGAMPFKSFVAPPGRIGPTFAVETRRTVKGDADPATVEISLNGPEFPGSGSIGARPGKVIEFRTGDLSPNATGATIRANVAAGAWKTVGATGNGGNMTVNGVTQIYFFPPFVRDHGSTGLIIDATGKMFAQGDLRMMAIDRNGATHVGSSRGRDQSENSVTAEFDVQLPSEAIDHWEVQVRPFDQWIEIRNVAVRPGENNQVQIVTSDQQK